MVRLLSTWQHFWSWLTVPQALQVYHQDSPGVRVFVRRTGWQRLLRNRTFSSVGERHLSLTEAFPHLVGTKELLPTSQRVVQDFNDHLAANREKVDRVVESLTSKRVNRFSDP